MEEITLFWADKWINSYENRIYQKKLQTMFTKCVFCEALKMEELNKLSEQRVVILGPSIAYQLPNNFKDKFVLFCRVESKHVDLLIKNQQIITIVSVFEIQLEEVLIKYKQFLQTKQELQSAFQSQTDLKCDYNHCKYSTFLYFFVQHEKIKQKEEEYSESKMEEELKKLIQKNKDVIYQSKQMELNLFDWIVLNEQEKDEKRQRLQAEKVFNDMKRKAQIKKLNDPFKRLVYYYTNDHCYKELNQAFAKREYDKINQILLWIFKGFKENQNNQQVNCDLYRGITFEKEIDYRTVIQNLKKWDSIYWNTLTSTSKLKQVANKFIVGFKYSIIFEIKLDQENPHPHYYIRSDSEYDEQEVLLFPQFQFQCIQFSEQISKEGTVMTVRIKQVKNNSSDMLNEQKQNEFWLDEVRNYFQQKLELFSYIQLFRIIFLENYITQRNNYQSILQNETKIYFSNLIQVLQESIDDKYRVLQQQQYSKTEFTSFNQWKNQVLHQTFLLFNRFIIIIKDMCFLNQRFVQTFKRFAVLLLLDSTLLGVMTGFEMGLEVGATLGPQGAVIGAATGLIFGGMFTLLQESLNKQKKKQIYNKVTQEVEEPIKFEFQAKHLTDTGVNPRIELIAIRRQEIQIIWVIPKIDPKTYSIKENDQVYGQNYKGPRVEEKEVSIHLIGIKEKQVIEQSIVRDLNQNRYEVILYLVKKQELK